MKTNIIEEVRQHLISRQNTCNACSKLSGIIVIDSKLFNSLNSKLCDNLDIVTTIFGLPLIVISTKTERILLFELNISFSGLETEFDEKGFIVKLEKCSSCKPHLIMMGGYS